MALDRWQALIDRQIEEAIKDGRSDHLPGAGKPLKLDQNENVPDEFRMAYKILQENDLVPDWLMMGKDLEKQHDKLIARIEHGLRQYRAVVHHPQSTEGLRKNAEAHWKSEQRTLQEQVEQYNDLALTYNLKVPPGIKHRALFNLQREIERLLSA